jgi:hypothetical protein
MSRWPALKKLKAGKRLNTSYATFSFVDDSAWRHERCNNPLDAEQVAAEKEQLTATLRNLRDKGSEHLSNEVKSSSANTDRLRQILDSKDFASNFYVAWERVISAALTLVEWAVIPKCEDVAGW